MYAVIGQVVFSRQGRDKNRAFIVVAAEGDYVWLADGRLRLYTLPKKKKIKHIQPTYHVDYALAEKINAKRHIDEAEFRKTLKEFEQ